MDDRRTVEDRLRSEYSELLPAMHRTVVAVQTEIQHRLLPVTLSLDPYERVVVRARVKDCESALDALRRRQNFGLFDTDHPEQYSLTALPDLVGVRVLTFPHRRLEDVREVLVPRLAGWREDPVPGAEPDDEPIALKFSGLWSPEDRVKSEIQIVSLLVGLFWEAEHPAIYKPHPSLRGIAKSIEMRRRSAAVIAALRDFELEFERLIDEAAQMEPSSDS